MDGLLHENEKILNKKNYLHVTISNYTVLYVLLSVQLLTGYIYTIFKKTYDAMKNDGN